MTMYYIKPSYFGKPRWMTKEDVKRNYLDYRENWSPAVPKGHKGEVYFKYRVLKIVKEEK